MNKIWNMRRQLARPWVAARVMAAIALPLGLLGVGVQPAAAGMGCVKTIGAYTKGQLCDTQTLDVTHTENGLREVFILGEDHAVWHIWQRFSGDRNYSGWQSLGGYAIAGVRIYPVGNLIIEVTGSDSLPWCNNWSPSSWSGWYRC